MHRDLLALRRTDRAFSSHHRPAADGAVIGPDAFVLRFFESHGDDRLLIINLGRDIDRKSFPEPLVAPPRGKTWEVLWSSEEPDYGGTGTAAFETEKGWHLPANTLLVLKGV